MKCCRGSYKCEAVAAQKIDNVVSRFSVENFETTFFISKLATTNLTRYDWNKQNARLFDRAKVNNDRQWFGVHKESITTSAVNVWKR